jgi:transcriptional regulator with XRE-family HTH domain
MGITANRLLRQERLKRGWSEQDLADRIQQWEYEHGDGHDLPVDRNYVHRWETGKRGVSAFYAVRLEGVFGRSRQELGLVDRRSRQLVGSANIRSADDGEPIPPVESAGDAMLGASPESGSAVQRRAFNRLVVAGGMTAVGIAIAAERVASGPDAPSVTRPLVQLYAPEATTAIRKAMLAGDGATAVQEPDVTAFRQGVSRAWELRQSARYVELLSVLPALILEAEAAIQHVDGDERVRPIGCSRIPTTPSRRSSRSLATSSSPRWRPTALSALPEQLMTGFWARRRATGWRMSSCRPDDWRRRRTWRSLRPMPSNRAHPRYGEVLPLLGACG